nr:hypothetical protein [Bacteroidota bacterium]
MKSKDKARFDIQLPKEQKEHNANFTSVRDYEIFFDALINPPEPNYELKNAYSRFNDELGKS